MRIVKKFLSLTKLTYPHGTERGLINQLPNGYKEDGFGNYYIQIGEKPSTMFTCHLDTADRKQTKVNHIFEGNIVKTDGTSILGADDKAGMTVILYMISKKTPGLYFFFIGEEVGCIGSRKLSKNWKTTEFSKHITKVVSFDRRGNNSIITHQMMDRCCSEEFATELAKRMNSVGRNIKMELDNTGVLTDSINFVNMVPECTNISVGYKNEHTGKELQDIDFLIRLCECVIKVDWETLPIEYEEKSKWFEPEIKTKEIINDPEWSENNWTWVSNGERAFRAFLSETQISDEKYIIWEWINKSIFDVRSITWNGRSLYIEKKDGKLEFFERVDLVEHIPQLKKISSSMIKEKL